jgi:hypothetical protein
VLLEDANKEMGTSKGGILLTAKNFNEQEKLSLEEQNISGLRAWNAELPSVDAMGKKEEG